MPIMIALIHQWVAVEDAPEMAWVLDAKRETIEQTIQEEQAQRVQVATIYQMQLQAMERVEAQENKIEETQCSVGRAPGSFEIFTWRVLSRISSGFTTP